MKPLQREIWGEKDWNFLLNAFSACKPTSSIISYGKPHHSSLFISFSLSLSIGIALYIYASPFYYLTLHDSITPSIYLHSLYSLLFSLPSLSSSLLYFLSTSTQHIHKQETTSLIITDQSHHRAQILLVWMDPSTGQHQQMSSQSLENMIGCSKAQVQQQNQNQQERKPRPQPEQALKCPRCDSTNTKFCYYNNYSLSQPRYFCKSCRRYWTKGGTLRNVPVGGGCRKNKRSSSSSSSSSSPSSSSRRAQDQINLTPNSNPLITTLPPLSYDTNDLTLALARLQKHQMGFDDSNNGHHHHDFSMLGNPLVANIIPSSNTNTSAGFLDALRGGFLDNSNNSLQNLYYGSYGNGGDLGEVDDHNGSDHNDNKAAACGVNINGEMMMFPPYDQEAGVSNATTQAVTVTTMKQEICSNDGRELLQGETNKVLWGLPWQLSNGDTSTSNMGEIDSAGRPNWNGLTTTPSWHGLLNSPLM